jgi:tRNA pseudouridine55 synthase
MTALPRRRRRIDGVLLFDKPVGWSSNAALQKVKWLLRAEKAGHTGTLDPFASGLLPICLGEATKFSQFLLNADKVYLAEIQLGVRTTTADPEGEIIATRPVTVDRLAVEAVLPQFTGNILQVPPMHSALKRDGRPLYEYARRGESVAREARPVVVHHIEFLALQNDRLTLRVHSSKGLYVRTLAEDIGAALGCGAYLLALRREAVGPFRLESGIDLSTLEAATETERATRLWPTDCLLGDLPRLELDVDSAWQFGHGQAIWRSGLQVGAVMAVYARDRALLGVAEVNAEGKLAPRRLLTAAPVPQETA